MRKVYLTHMGSPSNREEIYSFLRNIFTDTSLIKIPFPHITGPLIAYFRKRKTEKKFLLIGGSSPLKAITFSLTEKLNGRLSTIGVKVEAAFTHMNPYLNQKDTMGAFIFPLYPQYSIGLTGRIETIAPHAEVLKSWHLEPEFLKCMESRIRKSLELIEKSGRVEPVLLFIAHSVPLALVRRGDPYKAQVEETFEALKSMFPGYNSLLGYLGKTGPVRWLGPEVKKVIENLTFKHKRTIVVVYLSLPLDHLEVLYDIDVKLRKEVEEMGFAGFVRVPMPNADEDFVEAIEKIIRRKMQ